MMLLLYGSFAYDLERSDFPKLIGLVFGLFVFSYLLIERFGLSVKTLIVLGVLARLVFIIALPNLSQDYFRFIWDGRLLLEGINPYLESPELIMFADGPPIKGAQYLIDGMGTLNAYNYSNYPPVNQLCFALAAFLGGNSILGTVVGMRLIIIAADIGILLIGLKLLRHLNLNEKNIFWYFLNPFIIIELTGNLHFEGVMCFFLLLGLYLLVRQKWVLAAICIGVSISVKLIPLMLLPLLFRSFVSKKLPLPGLLKLTGFYALVLGTVALSFSPFLSEKLIANFSSTIGLWFQKFEFNASIYYIIREIGYSTVGWNIIETVGKILPVIVFVVILLLSFFRKNETPKGLYTGMLFAIGFYLLLSTTVHPWYLTTPLLLSIFTKYRFILLWSGIVFLSYLAYGAEGFKEINWVVGLEYVIVAGYFFWEIWPKKFKASSEKTLHSQ